MSAIIKTFAAFALTVLCTAAPAAAGVDCQGVQRTNAEARAELNGHIDDERIKISDRKTLVIHSISALSANGCSVELTARVTVERKRRQDAHGTVTLDGHLRPMLSWIPGQGLVLVGIKLTEVEFLDVDVSHLTSLGEAIWRKIANTFMDVIEFEF